MREKRILAKKGIIVITVIISFHNLFSHVKKPLFIIKKLIKLFYLICSSKKVVEKSNKDNLKVIKNTLLNKSGNTESLQK